MVFAKTLQFGANDILTFHQCDWQMLLCEERAHGWRIACVHFGLEVVLGLLNCALFGIGLALGLSVGQEAAPLVEMKQRTPDMIRGELGG